MEAELEETGRPFAELSEAELERELDIAALTEQRRLRFELLLRERFLRLVTT